MRPTGLCPLLCLLLAVSSQLSARTLTNKNPELSITIPDTFQAKTTGATDWSIKTADGNGIITFTIRPLAARGGPYADIDQAVATLTADVRQKLRAHILADTTRPSGERHDRLLEFSWRNDGNEIQNIEVFTAADGRLLNFTLIAPRSLIDTYRAEFFGIVDSLRLGPASPFVIHTDTALGLRIPIPRRWARREKYDRVLFFEPASGDNSSILIQSFPPPAGKEPPAVELTLLLYKGLSKNPNYGELKAHGKTQVNGLDLYIISARNIGAKKPGKEVFIQIDRGKRVAALNLTLAQGHEKKWNDYVAALLTGIAPAAPAAETGDASATIAGTVRDDAGQAARGVKVTLTLVTGFDPLSGAVIAETTTDANGRYTFTAGPDLPYLIHAGDSPEAFNAGTGTAGRRFVDLAREDAPPALDIVLTRHR